MTVWGRHAKRGLVGVLSTLVLLPVLTIGPAAADHREHSTVLRAADAVEASIAWSGMRFPEGAETALLATDGDFADALAGGLAQGTLAAPLLLTDGDALDARTRAELERLGATTVHLLGGFSALSEDIETELTGMGLTHQRHAGATRVETAVALAQSQAPEARIALLARAFGDAGGDPTRAWADSLAAGAVAAQTGRPLLLTASDGLPDSLVAHLDQSDVVGVLLVGGTAAVSEQVETQLISLGLQVERVAGATRADTAVALAARRGFPDAAAAETVVVVDGQAPQAWAAGLTAAGAAATAPAPILLAAGDVLPPETEDFLATAAEPRPVLVCAPLLELRACDAAAGSLGYDALHANATASDAPELVRVELRSSDDDAVVVRYVFDENVTVARMGTERFRLVPPDPNAAVAAAAAAVSDDDPTAVDVRFAAAHAAVYATVAIADAGAVEDEDGTTSPDGSAELAESAQDGGRTRRPDLLAAEVFNGGVALSFDAPVDTAVGRQVVAVRADGRVIEGGNASVTEGGRVVRVAMDGLVAADVRRVAARPGAVFTRQGSNPLSVVPVADGGLTDGPDLVDVVLREQADEVDFVFDMDLVALDEAGDTVGFRLRYEDGTETTSANTTELLDPRTVRARFSEGAVNRLVVAAAVAAEAVVTAEQAAAADDAQLVPRAFAFGESLGPVLVAAEAAVVESEGMTAAVPGGTQLRLVFDRPVTQVSTVRVAAIDAEGERVPVSDCSVEAGMTQDEVTCSVPPAPVGSDTVQLVAASVAFDAVRAVQSWRTGTEPASGFGRTVSMPGLPATVPFG